MTRRAFTILLLTSLLAGCGYQLRGQYALPDALSRLQVTGIGLDSSLGWKLARELRRNGIRLQANPEGASAHMHVSAYGSEELPISVGSDAEVREYELIRYLTFRVEGIGNDYALAEKRFEVRRTYQYDISGILGQAAEKDLLLQEMEDDLVRLVLYRLQSEGATQ